MAANAWRPSEEQRSRYAVTRSGGGMPGRSPAPTRAGGSASQEFVLSEAPLSSEVAAPTRPALVPGGSYGI